MEHVSGRSVLLEYLRKLTVKVAPAAEGEEYFSATGEELAAACDLLPPAESPSIVYIHPDDSTQIITSLIRSIEQGYLPVVLPSGFTGDEAYDLSQRFHPAHAFYFTEVRSHPFKPVPFEIKEDDAVIILTSGSSGKPKAVTHTFNSLLKAGEDGNRALGVTKDDVFHLSLPLNHISGLMILIRAAIAGATVLINRTGVEDLGPIQPTISSLVPTQLKQMLAEEKGPGKLRVILLGGSASEPELVSEAIKAGYPIYTVYGSSETAAFIAIARPEKLAKDPKAGYTLIDGVEIKQEGGELLVKSDHLFNRYLDDPELTASVFDDGFYRTNDLCEISETGEFRISGRKNRFIISGGVNIDPVELETVIREFPAIDEVFVFGMPNEKWGEAVAALIVANSEFEFQDLHSFLRTKITPYKIPKYYRLVDEIPVTSIGKFDPVESRRVLFER